MKVLVLAALLGLVLLSEAGKIQVPELKCGKCDKDACPVISCLAGKTKDDCGCCEVCNKMEGEACDPTKKGDCGTGLACEDVGEGHYCLCETEEVLCGSDEQTYNNICQMYAASTREDKSITKVKAGPCDEGARIVTGPEYAKNFTGGSVVLSCEATGNPTPYVAWLFTRVDGKTFPVPGDDPHILTAARGGPGKFQVTGWMQIEGLEKHHEGDYTCVAKNGDKKVHSKARVKVMNPGEGDQ